MRPAGITRREMLAGAGGTLVLTACSSQTVESTPMIDTTQILSDRPFYIAHRGSGDNWTEHTAEAYKGSITSGLKALEISVQMTSDGVPVCHHDVSTLRLTGVDKLISETPYAQIALLRNNARAWLGPAAPQLPIPKLKDVLDLYAHDHIIFIEDKTGKNFSAVTKLMKSYPNATKHFVWKQLASSKSYQPAADLGFKTWGYFPPDLFNSFTEYAKNFDYVGIYFTATDQQISELIAQNKPVICWEVHNRSTRDRMIRLGVDIMMCSNVKYVRSSEAIATVDAFATGLRAAGDLPSVVDGGWKYQPVIQRESASILMNSRHTASYIMGSMAPIAEPVYTLEFSMRWPKQLPREDHHAGVAFGQESDAAYVVQSPASQGGYHLILRPSGEVALYSRAAGKTAGTKIATVLTPVVEVGQWMSFRLRVDAAQITFERTDVKSPASQVRNSLHRGRYFALTKNYGGDADVEFKAVSIT